MKRFLLIFFVSILIFGCGDKDAGSNETYSRKLKVLCSEPFLSKGIWEDFSYFEARYDCDVVIEEYTDPGDILDLLQEKKDSLDIDVICSIPSSLIEEFNKVKVYDKTEIENRKFIKEKFYFDKESQFIPYALSYLCLAFNGRKVHEPPLNLGELQDNVWSEMIIMPDPITTGLGRAMLHYSAAKFGRNGFRYMWKGIQKNFLLYADSYDEGYRRFMSEEGYLMPGLISQMRYHSQEGYDKNIRGIILQEGSYRYTENAVIYNGTSNPVLAKKFLEYLLASDFQRRVWLYKWMYPVNEEIIAEFGLNDDIATYEKRCNNPSQAVVRKEESLWLKKLERTLERN